MDTAAATTLLSVDQVATQLGMHVRTVRRYVREGRPLAPEAPVPRQRQVEASTVVQIDAISPQDAQRVVNGVGGALKGRDRNTDTPLRVETVYDEIRARLKIIITGSLGSTSALLQLVTLYTQ
jgi:transposase